MNHCTLSIVAWLALAACTVAAQEPAKKEGQKRIDALSVVSQDAVLAIAIRNVAELRERGDKFIDKTEFKTPFRLSDGYRFVVTALGLHKGLDEQGAAALMAFPSKGIVGDGDFFKELVLAAPIGDLPAMAGNFLLRPEDLAEGKLIDRETREEQSRINTVRYIARRGDHLLMAISEKALEQALKSKPLAGALPAEDREALAKDDLLFYANPKPLKEEWTGLLQEINRHTEQAPPEDAAVLREFAEATKELEFAVGGLRLDDGLGGTLVLHFKGDKSRAILTRLQGGGKAKTSLAALPAGRVLAAYAASGEGEESAAIARVLLHTSLTNLVVDTQKFISAGHRPNVVGVFGEVWQRLDGSRTALYENDNPQRDGAFCLLAVLDTDNAERFIADMTSLARFINASGLSLDDAAETIDAKTIAELIAQLGHDDYKVRQSATARLGLVGRAALPALETAAKSKDAEVGFRAVALKQQILAAAAEEREDLIKRDLLSQIKPNFAYFAKQETRSGRPVDIVQMKLNVDEATSAAELRRLLGPQWSKLRLATVGKRVIVLVGSNTDLLDKTIANVRDNESGLEAGAAYKIFRTRAHPERTVEFHLSLARAQQLVTPQGDPDSKPAPAEPAAMSSLGLSIAPQRVRLDLFSPFEEVKSVVKKMAW